MKPAFSRLASVGLVAALVLIVAPLGRGPGSACRRNARLGSNLRCAPASLAQEGAHRPSGLLGTEQEQFAHSFAVGRPVEPREAPTPKLAACDLPPGRQGSFTCAPKRPQPGCPAQAGTLVVVRTWPLPGGPPPPPPPSSRPPPPPPPPLGRPLWATASAATAQAGCPTRRRLRRVLRHSDGTLVRAPGRRLRSAPPEPETPPPGPATSSRTRRSLSAHTTPLPPRTLEAMTPRATTSCASSSTSPAAPAASPTLPCPTGSHGPTSSTRRLPPASEDERAVRLSSQPSRFRTGACTGRSQTVVAARTSAVRTSTT